MGGFDNGAAYGGGLFAQNKQFGAVLRGIGAPAPSSGSAGDVYVDTQSWLIYCKRQPEGSDPWGDYIFMLPATYRSGLKWFSSSPPTNDIGVNGDYCLLWGGYSNYGTQPSIYGPKVDGCWPEIGSGPDILLDPAYAGYTLPVGLADEGDAIAYSASTQLIVTGLVDEYILAIPLTQLYNSPNTETGLDSLPASIVVNVNPLYTADSVHKV